MKLISEFQRKLQSANYNDVTEKMREKKYIPNKNIYYFNYSL